MGNPLASVLATAENRGRLRRSCGCTRSVEMALCFSNIGQQGQQDVYIHPRIRYSVSLPKQISAKLAFLAAVFYMQRHTTDRSEDQTWGIKWMLWIYRQSCLWSSQGKITAISYERGSSYQMSGAVKGASRADASVSLLCICVLVFCVFVYSYTCVYLYLCNICHIIKWLSQGDASISLPRLCYRGK